MPLLKSSDPLPEWSELDFIHIIEMKKDEEKFIIQQSIKEKIFIGEGECSIYFNNQERRGRKEDVIELNKPGWEVKVKAFSDSVIIHLGGKWSDEKGSCGVFKMNNSDNPKNIGDPVNYDRTTDFDNHFHDCDEYWIIFKGSGLAVSEGKKYELKSGYILATKMGDHHDLPEIYEEIQGVWFETTLKVKKRTGHLWNHAHN